MKEGEIMKKGKIKRNGPGNLKSIRICKANYTRTRMYGKE